MKKIAPLLLLIAAIIVGCNKADESNTGSMNTPATNAPASTNMPSTTP